MGMFDNINYEMDCPRCNHKVDNFQSKDGPCLMESLEFWEVNDFYSHCRNCGNWIEFIIERRPNRRLRITDYKKIIKQPSKAEQKDYAFGKKGEQNG